MCLLGWLSGKTLDLRSRVASLSFCVVALSMFILSALFVLILYVPVNNFSVMSGQFPVLPGCRNCFKQRIKRLAQGYSAVPTSANILLLGHLGTVIIWASTRENPSSVVCEHQRHRPACPFAQSGQCLYYSLTGKHHI